jgi:hypothetical protein
VTSRLTSPEIAFIFLLLIAAVFLFYGLARRYDSEADEHQEHEEQLREVEAMTASPWEDDEDEREASTCQRKHAVVSGLRTQRAPAPLQCGEWPCRRATRSAPPSWGPRDSVTGGRFDRSSPPVRKIQRVPAALTRRERRTRLPINRDPRLVTPQPKSRARCNS